MAANDPTVLIASNSIEGKLQMDKILETKMLFEEFVQLNMPSNRSGTACIRIVCSSLPGVVWREALELKEKCPVCVIVVICSLNTEKLSHGSQENIHL